jgi:hypothetical protein
MTNFNALFLLVIILIFLTSTASGVPQVFWASDPVSPDEAVMLIGDSFGRNPKIEIARLNNHLEDIPTDVVWNGTGTMAKALQADKQSVKFIVPSEFKEGVYAVKVTNDGGSAVCLLNAPTIYWTQGDGGMCASPGGWIRIFGRCVGHMATDAVLLMTSAEDGSVRRIVSKSASMWEAKFSVPEDLKQGQYNAFLHNGRGDGKAWAKVGGFEIKIAEKWPGKIFNVKEFGAVGNDTNNDSKAILAAIKSAKDNGGGIVYFPRGRYLMTDTLPIPKFVTLRGERCDLVNIIWQDMENPPEYLVYGNNHFAIEDITFYASNYVHVIGGDLKNTEAGEPGNIRLYRIRVRADIYRGHLKPEEIDLRFRKSLKYSSGGGDTIHLGGENIVITDCDLYGSGRSIFLYKPKCCYVARNQLYNGRWGWYSLTGVDGLIFEDNTITGADLMSTGGGINALGDVTYTQNVFYARNKINLIHGWDREAITSDAGYGYYYGSVSNVTADSITMNDEPAAKIDANNPWKGAGIFILNGKGMGQLAQVDHVDGNVVYMDRPWKVLPDKTSVVTITKMQQNYLFVDNEFVDAGVAIQYYGTSINHVASGNKSTRTGGFYNSGRWYRHYQPSWYCQFLDNEILEGNIYRSGANNAVASGEAILGTLGLQQPPNTAPLALGAVHRRNHLYSNAHIEITGLSQTAPGVRDVIIENNIIENSDFGIKFDRGSIKVLERGNIFNNVKKPVKPF